MFGWERFSGVLIAVAIVLTFICPTASCHAKQIRPLPSSSIASVSRQVPENSADEIIGSSTTPPIDSVFQGKVISYAPISMDDFEQKIVPRLDWLFENGFEDPYGLEYRNFEIQVGNVWSKSAHWVRTRGWVYPEGKNSRREGIAWNGLRYEVASLGDLSDLASDCRTLVEKARQQSMSGFMNTHFIGHRTGPNHIEWFRNFKLNFVAPERICVSPTIPRLMKVALLHRYGWASQALDLWNSIFYKCSNVASEPFRELTMEAGWNVFDRAVCAHKRGDDHIALRELRGLLPFVKACRKVQQIEGLKMDRRSIRTKDGKPHDNYWFCNPAIELLRDQERRFLERQSDHPPEPFPKLASYPEDLGKRWEAELAELKKQSIPYLIRKLEDVALNQWGQPGGVSIDNSRVVRALIAKGKAAIDPLVECLEKDNRLSRTVSFSRDFHPHRSIWSVPSFASYALCAILEYNSLVENRREKPDREKYIRRLKTFIEKYGDLSPVERYYEILKDDGSSWDQWVESAVKLTQETDEDLRIGGGLQWVTVPNRKPGQRVPLRGDQLRGKVSPTIESLLIKRMKTLEVEQTRKVKDHFYNSRAEDGMIAIERCLAKWNPGRAKSLLEKLVREFHEVREKLPKWEWYSKEDQISRRILDVSRSTRRQGYPGILPIVASWATVLHPVIEREIDSDTMGHVTKFLLEHLDQPCVKGWFLLVMEIPEWEILLLKFHPMKPSFFQKVVQLSIRRIGETGALNGIHVADIPLGETRILQNDRMHWKIACSIGSESVEMKGWGSRFNLCPPAGGSFSFTLSDVFFELLSRFLEIGPFRVCWDPTLRAWGKRRILSTLGLPVK